jgi:hypothetical protein
MITRFQSLSFIGFSLLLPLTTSSVAIADDYHPWISAADAQQFCDTQNVQNLSSANGYNNQAEVTDTAITSTTYTQNQIVAGNTGWATQSIGSIESRNCSGIIQAEAYRYATYQNNQTVRDVNEANLRQGLLGNLLKW